MSLNGIGHEDVIEKFVPMEKIFIGNTMWTAGLEGPGKAKLFGSGSVELQNLGIGKKNQRKIGGNFVRVWFKCQIFRQHSLFNLS